MENKKSMIKRDQERQKDERDGIEEREQSEKE